MFNTGYRIDTGYRIQNTGYRIQDTGYRIQNTGYRIQDTGYRIQDTGYRIQDTGYRIQHTGYRIQDTRCRTTGYLRFTQAVDWKPITRLNFTNFFYEHCKYLHIFFLIFFYFFDGLWKMTFTVSKERNAYGRFMVFIRSENLE